MDTIPILGPVDLHLFNEGRHLRLYEKLGGHLGDGEARFAVWAPNARSVSVVHDRNGWAPDRDPLQPEGESGIWAGAVRGIGEGTCYKFHIVGNDGLPRDKADPCAFASECPPRTGSVLAHLEHKWSDSAWMDGRSERQSGRCPMSTYEVHLGSWRRRQDGTWMSYEEVAEPLAAYVSEMGFTHVEFLPLMEHPFYGSWGYQSTGYFAPTARYGSPEGLMQLVDTLHQAGIGVILDWVPSHFATDAFSLGEFDGTHLYEHADPLQRSHPDWGSYLFNYGRHEVRSFLISSACFWLETYHADGFRVDAVASMLYLDYSRQPGQWVPNRYGGRENLEAIHFLREMNDAVHERFPGVLTIAEESTAWPGVTRSTAAGGLGFDLKWDMGWMHDTLTHLSRDPLYRSYHYGELTFRGLYAFTERFALPLSHDEVVHGKGSLLGKMPGDEWQRLANLRLLLALQSFQPGKKLLFMGSEIGSWREWDHDGQLDWWLLDEPSRAGIARLVADLNRCHRDMPALHEGDLEPGGFRWIVADDSTNCVLAWLRQSPGGDGRGTLAVVVNCTPMVREHYRLGLPFDGPWREVLNTDSSDYGGTNQGNFGVAEALATPSHGFPASVELRLPPLGVLVLEAPERSPERSPGRSPAEGAGGPPVEEDGEKASEPGAQQARSSTTARPSTSSLSPESS